MEKYLNPHDDPPQESEDMRLSQSPNEPIDWSLLIKRPTGLANWYIEDDAGKSLDGPQTLFAGYILTKYWENPSSFEVVVDMTEYWKNWNNVKYPSGSHYANSKKMLLDTLMPTKTYMRYTDPLTGSVIDHSLNWFTESYLIDDHIGIMKVNPSLFALGTYQAYPYALLRKLETRYDRRLFEHFIDCLSGGDYAEVSFSLAEFLQIIDATHIHTEPKYINRDIYKPAIKKINDAGLLLVKSEVIKKERRLWGWSHVVTRVKKVIDADVSPDTVVSEAQIQKPVAVDVLPALPEVIPSVEEDRTSNIPSKESDVRLAAVEMVKAQIQYDSLIKDMNAGLIIQTPKRLDQIVTAMTDIYCAQDAEMICLTNNRKMSAKEIKSSYKKISKDDITAILKLLKKKNRVNDAYIKLVLVDEPANIEGNDNCLGLNGSNFHPRVDENDARPLDSDELAAIQRMMAEDI